VEQLTVIAPDISCEHCQRAIESALGALDGVETVSVDVEKKAVSVSFDSSATSPNAIRALLDEEGYPAAEA